MSSNGSTSLDVHDLWVTWILSDSAFPSGALAVSQGLESAAQHGLVCSAASLRRFFAVSLEQAALQMLPFVLSSHHHAGSNPTSGECDDEGRSNRQIDRSSVVLLDAYCHAMLSSEVARRASISQGKCLLRVIKSSCPALEEELVGLFEASGSVNSHYAVVFGVVCCWLGIARDVAAALFMKIFLRDLVSAAVRLNIIGPMEGTALQFQYKDLTVALMQRVLSSAATAASAAAAAAATHESDASPLFVGGIEPQQVAPILEVAQGRHDLLYTRLFNS